MITYFQALILGLLQGISELFPVSSLGHSVIIPKLLGWQINQSDSVFLNFLVATHLATATVLFLFYWKDWKKIIFGLGRSLRDRQIKPEDASARLGWLLVAGTIPAGILGLIFKDAILAMLNSASYAALFLILNGLMLFGAEFLRKKAPADGATIETDQRLAKLTWWQTIKVGLSQVLALLPGMSRSGSTMTGSLLVGLSHEDALRFSFLLATPIIGGAAIIQLPQLFLAQNHFQLPAILIGAISAACGAYFAVKFLSTYFKTNKLTPFAIYCISGGVIYSIILHFR